MWVISLRGHAAHRPARIAPEILFALLLTMCGGVSVAPAQPLLPSPLADAPAVLEEPVTLTAGAGDPAADESAEPAEVDTAQVMEPSAADDPATEPVPATTETPTPAGANPGPVEPPPRTLPPGAAAIQAPDTPVGTPPGAAAERAPNTTETPVPTATAPPRPGTADTVPAAPAVIPPQAGESGQAEAGTAEPAETAAAAIAPAAPPNVTEAVTDETAGGEPGSDRAGGFFDDIAWNGFFKNETAYRIKEPRSITKMRNVAGLTGVYSFTPRYRLTGSGWIYYDMAYDLYDYDTIVARLERNSDEPLTFLFNLGKEKDSFGADLREFYLDMMFDNVDVRLGRQLVVWGVLEGVRIVDEINPQDFRELIMPDLLDYRIPLWMAKVDWYRDEGAWQFLWIPDIRFHKPAPPGSEWELLQEVPGTLYPDSWNLKNSEFGARLSTNLWDTDLTFSYFYTWDDFPVIYRRILLNTLDTDMQFLPTFTRMTMYGGTATRQIGPAILKGEFAYVTGKYFAVDNVDRNGDGFLDSLGEIERDHIRWGLGVEFNWNGMDISPGMTQWIIPEYDPAMVQDQVDTSVNLFLRKEYPRSSMLFELLAIRFVNLRELYVNPEWTFFISDRFQIATGVDLFSGGKSQFGVLANPLGSPTVRDQRSQFVGNFHDNDRFYVEFTYSY